MGLKNFLKQRGFIEDEPGDKNKEHGDSNTVQQPLSEIAPTFFLFYSTPNEAASTSPVIYRILHLVPVVLRRIDEDYVVHTSSAITTITRTFLRKKIKYL